MRVSVFSIVPSLVEATSLRRVGAVVLGVALITASAKTQIPFFPVPMTLHTLAAALISVAYGPRLAVATFLAYLVAGAAGWPVFSGTPERGVGVAYMVGPTGGYLLGYLVASDLIGRVAAGGGFVRRAVALTIGLVAIYGGGVAWLAFFVPQSRLFELGVAPFILGDLLKVSLVALVAPVARRLARPLTDR